jgi:acyl-CoA hydrolase
MTESNKKIMEPVEITSMKLVKGEDLNHHGTLFAGRTTEWFVEAGFIAATMLVPPEKVVCLKLHEMYFTKPVRLGQILKFQAKVIYTGKSSLISYVQILNPEKKKPYVSGFITFINVDNNTKPSAHNIEIIPKTEEDIELNEIAKGLNGKIKNI